MQIDVSRQVLPITERLLQDQAKLGAVALRNRTKLVATSTKLEWKEMAMWAIKTALTTATASGYFDGTSKTIECDTTNLLVGDVVSFKTSTGTSKGDLRIMITEIVSSTEAKAQKIGWTDVAVATTDVLYVESTANEEGSTSKKRRPAQSPRTMYNHTQIIRAGHTIPRTQANIDNMDFKDIKAELRTQAYKRYADNFDGMVTSTVRTVITTAEGDKRISGWLQYFANNTFNSATGEYVASSTDNVDSSGWALSTDKVDKAFKWAIENGGSLNAWVLNTAQAIKLSKLYEDKVNVNILNGTTPTTVGGAVQVLKSPINIAGNEIKSLYVDLRMPQDEVTFFNENSIEAVPLKGSEALEEIKEPSAKDDNYSIDILWEWTIKVKNARENTFTLKGLDV